MIQSLARTWSKDSIRQSERETNPLLPFSDFIISCFRQELDLWFEYTEFIQNSDDLNQAVLSDGDSSLLLRFEGSHATETLLRKERYATQLKYISLNEVPLRVIGNFLPFSHRDFEPKQFETILNKAISEYAERTIQTGSSLPFTRLAIEIRFDPDREERLSDQWLDLVSAEFNGHWLQSPHYNLTFNAPENFKIEEIEGLRWAQVILSNPIGTDHLESYFARFFRSSSEIHSSTNLKIFATDQTWNQYGIRNIALQTRYY